VAQRYLLVQVAAFSGIFDGCPDGDSRPTDWVGWVLAELSQPERKTAEKRRKKAAKMDA
jgi:hypothetical protein